VQDRFNQSGMVLINPQDGLEVLEALLSQPKPQVGVLPIDWSQWIQAHGQSSFLADFKTDFGSERKHKATKPATFLHQLEALPAGDRLTFLSAHLQSQVAKVLGLDPTALSDSHQGFSDLGMDSLTSIELRNRLQSTLDKPLPSTLMYDYPTLAALTAYFGSLLFPSNFASTSASTESMDNSLNAHESTPISSNDVSPDLELLSDEEAEALLLDELKRLT
jgi:acyl carrier protein